MTWPGTTVQRLAVLCKGNQKNQRNHCGCEQRDVLATEVPNVPIMQPHSKLQVVRFVSESAAITVRSILAYDSRKSVARTAMGFLPNIQLHPAPPSSRFRFLVHTGSGQASGWG